MICNFHGASSPCWLFIRHLRGIFTPRNLRYGLILRISSPLVLSRHCLDLVISSFNSDLNRLHRGKEDANMPPKSNLVEFSSKDIKFRCKGCPATSQVYQAESSLVRHVRQTHDGNISAKDAKARFMEEEALFVCKLCTNKHFQAKSSLLRHFKQEHGGDEPASVGGDEETGHIKTEEDEMSVNFDDDDMAEPKVKQEAEEAEMSLAVVDDLADIQPSTVGDIETSIGNAGNRDFGTKDIWYECKICPPNGYKYRQPKYVKQHIKTRHADEAGSAYISEFITGPISKHLCNYCNGVFKANKYLTQHVKSKHPDIYSQSQANKSASRGVHTRESQNFGANSSFPSEDTTDGEDDRLENASTQSPVGGGQVNDDTSIDIHIDPSTELYKEIKVYRCTLCPGNKTSQYTNQGNLTRHVKNSHPNSNGWGYYSAYTNKVTTFRCLLCTGRKEFTNKGNANRHIRQAHGGHPAVSPAMAKRGSTSYDA
ncbi:C2H2-type zinc finger transcription factor [Zalerion maritima]|uniref:C2H2-type zinc finger transcription factor n=1 Tax=Zalerion maritima TaxID=339359 RepID=A0AAD5RMU9_9PEZI|nr:C2H2-type zinc finger transcription factor [Zalerion maritima]